MGLQAIAAVPAWTWAVPVIAALVAFIGVMITVVLQWRNFNKQLKSAHVLKVAEMRQNWINDLRGEMSAFQSYGVTPNLDHTAVREFYQHGTKIELLMNPGDPDYQDLRECLYGFLSADSLAEKYSDHPRFVEICQRILKREWEVLKAEIAAVT